MYVGIPTNTHPGAVLSGAGLSLPSLLLLQLASQAALRVTTLGEIIHYLTLNKNKK